MKGARSKNMSTLMQQRLEEAYAMKDNKKVSKKEIIKEFKKEDKKDDKKLMKKVMSKKGC